MADLASIRQCPYLLPRCRSITAYLPPPRSRSSVEAMGTPNAGGVDPEVAYVEVPKTRSATYQTTVAKWAPKRIPVPPPQRLAGCAPQIPTTPPEALRQAVAMPCTPPEAFAISKTRFAAGVAVPEAVNSLPLSPHGPWPWPVPVPLIPVGDQQPVPVTSHQFLLQQSPIVPEPGEPQQSVMDESSSSSSTEGAPQVAAGRAFRLRRWRAGFLHARAQ